MIKLLNRSILSVEIEKEEVGAEHDKLFQIFVVEWDFNARHYVEKRVLPVQFRQFKKIVVHFFVKIGQDVYDDAWYRFVCSWYRLTKANRKSFFMLWKSCTDYLFVIGPIVNEYFLDPILVLAENLYMLTVAEYEAKISFYFSSYATFIVMRADINLEFVLVFTFKDVQIALMRFKWYSKWSILRKYQLTAIHIVPKSDLNIWQELFLVCVKGQFVDLYLIVLDHLKSVVASRVRYVRYLIQIVFSVISDAVVLLNSFSSIKVIKMNLSAVTTNEKVFLFWYGIVLQCVKTNVVDLVYLSWDRLSLYDIFIELVSIYLDQLAQSIKAKESVLWFYKERVNRKVSFNAPEARN